MTTSLANRIRRTVGLLVAVTVIATVGLSSAFAGGRPAASYYTKQQLETMSQSWAVKAALSSLTPAQRTALIRAWPATGPVVRSSQGSGFQWGDFGIGAAAMFGLALLVGGGALATRLSRQPGVPVRVDS